jgi:DmsE family decaheme c-type cytochrome
MLMKMTVRQTAVLAMALMAIALPAVTHAQADGDGAELPDYSRKGADTCFQCHDDQVMLAIFRTKHAMPQDPDSPFGHGQLQCEACHGPAGDHAGRVRRGQERPPIPAFGSMSTTSIAGQNAYCIECHAPDTGFAWHGSSHDDDTIACADCHTMHAERDPVLAISTQADVCFDCHQQQRTQAMKPYAHPVRQGKMACTSCHSPHGDTPERLLAGNSVNGTCYDCHAELRGPYLWEHAPATENCNNCHNPHGSTQPGMLSMRAPMLCQSCHSQNGHPSLPQDASGLANNMPSALLLGQSCLNCHDQVHGSNHPSGSKLMR